MTKFLFDLDGTITEEETLPLIADFFGVEGVRSLTRETVAGRVPFEESFLRRVELLKDLPVDGIARLLGGVGIYPSIEEFIRVYGEHCCVVTGNLSCWVELLVRRLSCRCYASEAVVEDNHIKTLKKILRKEHIVRDMQREGHRVVFIGDGDNDAEAMRLADWSVASALTHAPSPRVLAAADVLVSDEAELCRRLREWL